MILFLLLNTPLGLGMVILGYRRRSKSLMGFGYGVLLNSVINAVILSLTAL